MAALLGFGPAETYTLFAILGLVALKMTDAMANTREFAIARGAAGMLAGIFIVMRAWEYAQYSGTFMIPVVAGAVLVVASGIALAAQFGGDSSASGVSSNALRRCPYCAEPIRAEAVKCRHCGSEVAPVVLSQPPVEGIDDPDALDRATEEAMRE